MTPTATLEPPPETAALRYKAVTHKGHWLWGGLPEFKRGMLEFFERMHRDYGTAVHFRLGPRRLLLLTEPDLIEEVLLRQTRNFHKHWAFRLLIPVLGKGLVLSEGDFWLKQRRLIQPAFSRKLTEMFAEIVVRRANDMAKVWSESPRRDLYRDMTTLTVQIAAEAMLGADMPAELEAIEAALEVIHGDFESRFKSAFNIPAWIPTAKNRRRAKAIAVLDDLIDRMIAERKSSESQGGDALSLMIAMRDEDGRGMPDKQIRDEVMTLLLAGHDTTANTLTWTWFLLSQNPSVADAVSEEVTAVIGDRDPTADDLAALSYTGKVTKEVLRLMPAAYVFGRQAIQDTNVVGVDVPKGTNVLMCQWVVHRDERFYDDPLAFNPDRWTPEFEANLPKFAYFPFGGGPRICIGKELALLEGTLITAVLGARFRHDLEDPAGVVPWPTVTLRPRDAVWANAITR